MVTCSDGPTSAWHVALPLLFFSVSGLSSRVRSNNDQELKKVNCCLSALSLLFFLPSFYLISPTLIFCLPLLPFLSHSLTLLQLLTTLSFPSFSSLTSSPLTSTRLHNHPQKRDVAPCLPVLAQGSSTLFLLPRRHSPHHPPRRLRQTPLHIFKSSRLRPRHLLCHLDRFLCRTPALFIRLPCLASWFYRVHKKKKKILLARSLTFLAVIFLHPSLSPSLHDSSSFRPLFPPFPLA